MLLSEQNFLRHLERSFQDMKSKQEKLNALVKLFNVEFCKFLYEHKVFGFGVGIINALD